MDIAVPILVAIISAITLISGYIYQKHREREADIRKKRQEIYSRLVNNLMKRMELGEQLMKSREWPSPEDPKYFYKTYDLYMRNPEMYDNLNEGREITALLALYGTDDAIEAYVEWIREGWEYVNRRSPESADTGKLIQGLRKSVYPKTRTTSEDINLAIRKRPK